MSDHHPSASQLLREAVDDLPVDVERIVRGGVARGRAARRRRRAGTSLAAAALVGAVGVAASVGPGVLDDARRTGADVATEPGGTALTDLPTTATTTDPAPPPSTATDDPTEATSDPTDPASDPTGSADPGGEWRIAVAAVDVPGIVAELAGGGLEAGSPLTQAPYGVADGPDEVVVHFLLDGTLTTVTIEPEGSVASCAAMVDPANQPDGQPGGECLQREGGEVLSSEPETADGITSVSTMAWTRGWVVSVVSTNDDAEKGGPVADAPPLTQDDVERVALADDWLSRS